jgi:HlyD family secretion protein
MDVTITVEAYPNRPFRGRVLKIEPQALVQQNVTMFPVLVRIANENDMLKPGMNAEVEVHIGERRGVLAVPASALRTDRDVASAAMVLDLDPEAVQEQITEARQLVAAGGETPAASNGEAPKVETVSMMGREVPVPEGYTAEQVRAVFTKMREGGGPQALGAGERAMLQKMRDAGGGQGRHRQQADDAALFGGDYIVFAMRNGEPTPVPIRTGLTDLDYSEVMSGLMAQDTVLIMPSASLIASQQEFQERVQRRAGGIPGVSRN